MKEEDSVFSILKELRSMATELQILADEQNDLSIEQQAIQQAEMIAIDCPFHAIIRLGRTHRSFREMLNIRGISEKVFMEGLKRNYSSLEAIEKVFKPILKKRLECLERIIQEAGYKLPEWDRPQWMREND